MDASIPVEDAPVLQPPFSPHHNLLNRINRPLEASSESIYDSSEPYVSPAHLLIPGSNVIPLSTLPNFLNRELSISRLDGIAKELWFAARPRQPEPLHTQRRKEREIVITTKPDRHLVVWRGGIYMKPLPRFLLDYDFFAAHLCESGVPEYTSPHANACGFLQSYVDLIEEEPDFKIAVETGLLPEGISWMRWAAFAADVRSHIGEPGRWRITINPRYHYGEMDRQQLNWLCWWKYGWKNRYYYIYNDYVDYVVGNFSQLVLVFAYASVLLSAMQLVVETELGTTQTFQAMSYVVGLMFVAAVLGGAACLGGVFIVYFMIHVCYRKRKRDREWRAASWKVDHSEKHG